MNTKPGPIFYLSMFVMIIITLAMHEAVHWLAGMALGYDMYFLLTYASVLGEGYRSDLDYQLVSAAGPAFTVTLGVFGAWLAIAKKVKFGYELIFVAAYQRLAAMVFSALGVLNDEARISVFLGWEWWILPALVVVPLWILVFLASRALRFGLLVNFLCYVTASLAVTLAVAADGQMFTERPSIFEPLLSDNVRAVIEERRGE